MNRLLLTLLVSPTLFGSLMSLSAIAQTQNIGETPGKSADAPTCVRSPHAQRLTCMRLPGKAAAANSKARIGWQRPNQEPVAMLDFTEEESDAAAALFGCDCQLCINSLRQLRGLPPLDLS
ncbi:MAG: hypothetical protein JGK24_30020 [Microcoleus sp. PH2017_29_MFU_D_A]|uniref:hypothetical protein n=1 Tax=unclassified Microcoleus TaxID=2642155 RepID=UPI001D9C7338|nr:MULTISPECIES: hypothetical protein [unclassified Microcoleus]MCC3442190.1 hypothetical protein [Microcoleus sp. PH2017_03_ELD_O_A]MCC3468312.1 hypothetical protein [Microcoleus sp. PH2017_06_SFM_O_A]MCC3504463.1 hypothetical protein [Microcoleus sp. PH2017_19_SFW_U_A]TAE10520.1 MAG: hypothetical protein EAZ94_18385 [Oscillatoriales cyanobacterium]MCC3426943.1 hypothetical protein [Microcoleus sp. PH2017_01_SCD_O_A]